MGGELVTCAMHAENKKKKKKKKIREFVRLFTD
jgi:hypothetical protein